MTKKTIFNTEYRIFGLRRSGIHAVSDWISSFSSNPRIVENNTDLRFFKNNTNLGKVKSFYKNGKTIDYQNISEHLPVDGIVKKLSDIDSEFMKDRERVLEKLDADDISQRVYNVVLVRSPENNLASILKMIRKCREQNKKMNTPWLKHFKRFPREWYDYMYRLYNELSGISGQLTVFIYFDEWNSSSYYRKMKMKQFGMKGDEDIQPPSKVSHIGSSFSEYNYKDVKNNINERWKEFENDEEFIRKLEELKEK